MTFSHLWKVFLMVLGMFGLQRAMGHFWPWERRLSHLNTPNKPKPSPRHPSLTTPNRGNQQRPSARMWRSHSPRESWRRCSSTSQRSAAADASASFFAAVEIVEWKVLKCLKDGIEPGGSVFVDGFLMRFLGGAPVGWWCHFGCWWLFSCLLKAKVQGKKETLGNSLKDSLTQDFQNIKPEMIEIDWNTLITVVDVGASSIQHKTCL